MKSETDRVIWRHDLPNLMCVHNNTISKWIKGKKFPEPDVKMTRVHFGWRLSTLRAHGINLA
jgi:hypothetical protein